MMILRSQPRFLTPVPKSQWRTPSQSLPKDHLGNEVRRTFFEIKARLNDGHTVWSGLFWDRDDFDAFLWAIATSSLGAEPDIWRLPTPQWHPDLGENLSYEFNTYTILTGPTGSNQTFTSPSDWANSSNSVECVGSGGTGAAGAGTFHATGGGGGAYSKINNFSFATPGTTTATFRVAARVTTGNTTTSVTGVNGTSTWWNSATDPGAGTDNTKAGAKGGNGGNVGAGSRNGANGGSASTSWGQTKFNGGNGGNLTGASGTGASGGGGAGGPGGAGNNGADSSSTGTGVDTNGGSGGGGLGGTGGLGGNIDFGGGAGADMAGGAAGSGGGGGGRGISSSPTLVGDGGAYGAGGGGVQSTSGNTVRGGFGEQGVIVLRYVPASATPPNLAMLGM